VQYSLNCHLDLRYIVRSSRSTIGSKERGSKFLEFGMFLILCTVLHRLEFSKFFYSVLLLLRFNEQSFPEQYCSPEFTTLSCMRYSLNIKFYQIAIFPNFIHRLFIPFVRMITTRKAKLEFEKFLYIYNFFFTSSFTSAISTIRN